MAVRRLVALVVLATVGSGVLVRYGLNRLAGGTAGPSLAVPLGFALAMALMPEMIWTAILDPRPIATLGAPPLHSTTELHDRVAEAPYPVYAAAEDCAQPASANRAASRTAVGTVVSDTFSPPEQDPTEPMGSHTAKSMSCKSWISWSRPFPIWSVCPIPTPSGLPICAD